MWDLIIIGGGINGTSLARLAAHNQLKVLLIEKGDLARGASSASSKLIHGGLRYLERFEIPLVTESLAERKVLLDNAPHLIEPKEFLFAQTPYNRHPRFIARLGLWLYKRLASRKPIDLITRSRSQQDLEREEPLFMPGKHKGALAYSDCQMDDSRLVIENAVDAFQHGAVIKTYTEFVRREGQVVFVKDRLTGAESQFETKEIALCTGAWTDERTFAEGKEKVLLQSQGTHLFVKNLPVKNCFILPVPQSKRICFVLPWLDGTLIGTTESKPPQHPDLCVPRQNEVEELSQIIGKYFPQSKPKGICAFAGIRPLAKTGNSHTIKASRKHKCVRVSKHLSALIGGKYTTHRLMVEEFFQFMGFDLNRGLENVKMPGARNFTSTSELANELKLLWGDKIDAHRLAKTYGTQALKIHFMPEIDPVISEAIWCKENEFCRTPTDFLRRRSNLFFSDSAGLEYLDALSEIFEPAPTQNWTFHYQNLLKDSLHVALKNSP